MKIINRSISSILVFLSAFVASGCTTTPNAPPASDWRLIYHHDKQGNPLYGRKQALIDLVMEGRPVRVVWPLRDDVAHAGDAGFLTVMNGEVFAQLRGIIRQKPDRETRKRIALDAEDQSSWHAILSTTGELRSFQSVKSKLADSQFELKWYAYSPPINS